MTGRTQLLAVLSLVLLAGPPAASATSFLCAEPGGKRLVRVSGKEVSLESDGKTLLYISGNDILPDIHSERIFVVDDHDVRHSSAGVKIAVFDGDNILHGVSDKVLIHYRHPSLSPDFRSDRIYSVEGDPLTKQQLVAALYVIKPEMFKLTDAETAEQQKAMKEAGEEDARLAAADQVAGKWTLLNSHGPVEKLGRGTITVGPKKGDAYPVTFDQTKGGGPVWNGTAFYKEIGGNKFFWAAYGTEKTVGLCVYEIKGGTLSGKWYPWYIDGDAKNVGTEELKGPETLDGDYQIVSAKAPNTGAAYTGTVSIKPLAIAGADDGAKPYSLTWTLGTIKINGIGIRTKNYLCVSSGTGADVNIAKFTLGNGSMNSDWYKLGSKEMGGAAAMKD